uniref:Uncharacterized protein n=1 Tax=Tanacetum cinerariifolium TaxID=118510 RepID=A0A6L2MEJ6_TANCI|nr:hypothetical protein [Tanacetum cinerariifolium]
MPNKDCDPFLKAGLDYKNLKRLKKAIAAQPKMYDGEKIHSTKLVIDSPNSEETLEDAEESRLKMRNNMIQINYAKLNALYETFVPQQDFSVEPTYFSIPSNSTNSSMTKYVTSDLPIPKMPKESKLLKMFDTLGCSSLYATGPIRSDFEWSNVPRVKFSLFSKSDDTFTSLQALLNLYYLFSGFMDYFWSQSRCEMTVTIRDDRYWHAMPGDYFFDVQPCKGFCTACLSDRDEMCRFGKAIDNDPNCVMSV